MHAYDTIPSLKGHWRLDVYDGDPEREPLTSEQARENALWATWHPDCPYPLHAGKIVSRPIDAYEGSNVVVTTGKQLYLDRTFAMNGPPAAANSLGVGATAAAAVVGDTQLGSTPTIIAFDALPVRTALVVVYAATFGTGVANISWNEMATFNGTVNGTSTMWNRIAPIGPFSKTSAVAITSTCTITAA